MKEEKEKEEKEEKEEVVREELRDLKLTLGMWGGSRFPSPLATRFSFLLLHPSFNSL